MGATCYNYLTITGNGHVNDLIDMIYKPDPWLIKNFPFFISLDNNPKAWYGLYTLLDELPEDGDVELTYTTKNSPPPDEKFISLVQALPGLKLINRFETLDCCGLQTIQKQSNLITPTALTQIIDTREYLKTYYQKEVIIPKDLPYKDFRDQYVENIDSWLWYTDNAGIHYDDLIEDQILDRIASNDLLLLINHEWSTPQLQTKFETLLRGA